MVQGKRWYHGGGTGGKCTEIAIEEKEKVKKMNREKGR